jgi:hypothetical protein
MADNFNARLYARAYGPSVSARAPSGKMEKADSCKPACATCGLLECLCRPRFFAGQMLSEVDLNRLDAYIRAKNRLHTLQLHGWGVVNGLLVRCDPCGSGVVVGTGYAINPCGEDIIVCDDTTVDICALIKQCTPPDVSCQPYSRGAGSSGCDDLVEDWVLAIRYSETPARGVTALRMGSTCGCGSTGGTCSSGNGKGCGCGGAVAKTSSTTPSNPMTSQTSKKPRGASPECEPTAICESYSFDVFKAPMQIDRGDKQRLEGGIIDAFMCCLQPLLDAIPKPPAEPTPANFNNPQLSSQWHLWCCQVKDVLIAHFSTGMQSNCELVTKLSALVCPNPTAANFGAAMAQAYDQLSAFLIEAFLACVCAALLPPAPFGTSDDRVPLAVVSVRKRDCKVMSVCNWTPLRKMVLTFPTLEYWLGWIPLFGSLREILSNLCCGEIEKPATVVVVDGIAGVPADASSSGTDAATLGLNPALDAQTAADNQTLITLIEDAFKRADKPIDAAAVIGGVFGFKTSTQAPFSSVEKANPMPFALLNQVLRPIAATAVPDDKAALYDRIAALEAAVAELKNQP